jgi:hypothetical protein
MVHEGQDLAIPKTVLTQTIYSWYSRRPNAVSLCQATARLCVVPAAGTVVIHRHSNLGGSPANFLTPHLKQLCLRSR